MKYIVDIDGTICDKPQGMHHDGDYSISVPIPGRVEKINKLYDEGHTIVYLTARGMGRFKDNADLARKEFYKFTESQLKSWGCKYHDLVLGKPSGDFYIDDKGINSNEFFE